MTRFCVNLGFFDRPIAIGFIWGAITGDLTVPLALAVFYELFWLDLFSAGTYVPPNALFPMLVVLTLAGAQTAPDPATLIGPVMLTLPLAHLGSYLEGRHRGWQTAAYNRVLQRHLDAASPEGAAAWSVGLSLLQLFSLNFCAFFTVASLCLLGADILMVWQKAPPAIAGMTWPLLWTIGAAGGLLALRVRRAYAAFVFCCVAAVATALFW